LPESQQHRSNDIILSELTRWRQILGLAVGVMAAVVSLAFYAERLSTRAALHAGNSLRIATEAQSHLWTAEAAVRALLLRPDVDTASAQRRAARTDSARVLLRALRDSVSDNATQVARVDSVMAALDVGASIRRACARGTSTDARARTRRNDCVRSARASL
jgi:hypothetical protein